MRYIEIPYKQSILRGTIMGTIDPRVVCIHGVSEEGSARFETIRHHLAKVGIASLSFDFIGAGETGGDLASTTLEDRLAQAEAVLQAVPHQKPLSIMALSMGADTALRLTIRHQVSSLILFVPAFYSREVFTSSIGREFHQNNIHDEQWMHSDTWALLREYRGTLLVIAAEHDQHIPEQLYDYIDEMSPNASRKELAIVKGSSHRVLPYLDDHQGEFARVFEKVYHAILE